MCRYVFPRTICRVPYLSSNQKLLQMQEYTHVLMELKDLGLLRGHLARDSTPCRMAGMEIKDPGHLARDSYLGLLGGH